MIPLSLIIRQAVRYLRDKGFKELECGESEAKLVDKNGKRVLIRLLKTVKEDQMEKAYGSLVKESRGYDIVYCVVTPFGKSLLERLGLVGKEGIGVLLVHNCVPDENSPVVEEVCKPKVRCSLVKPPSTQRQKVNMAQAEGLIELVLSKLFEEVRRLSVENVKIVREVVKELELERLKLTDLVISKVVRELADEVRRLRDEVNRLTAKPQTQIATIPILIGAVGKPLTEQQPSPYQPYSSQYSTPSQVTPVIPLEQGEKFKRTHERPSSVGKTGSKETVSKPVPIQIQAESDVEGVDERWRRWLENPDLPEYAVNNPWAEILASRGR